MRCKGILREEQHSYHINPHAIKAITPHFQLLSSFNFTRFVSISVVSGKCSFMRKERQQKDTLHYLLSDILQRLSFVTMIFRRKKQAKFSLIIDTTDNITVNSISTAFNNDKSIQSLSALAQHAHLTHLSPMEFVVQLLCVLIITRWQKFVYKMTYHKGHFFFTCKLSNVGAYNAKKNT